MKIVKPLALFADPAAATAPFVLPRIPFKVNRYWTFQTGAGDSPTLPVVVFQLFASQAYQEFFRLLENASPNQAKRLTRDGDETKNGNIKGLIEKIREIFQNEPSIAEKMLVELESAKPASADAKKHQLIRSLIKIYQGDSSRYINFYGPPRTITTIPYHQALQVRSGTIGSKKIDLKDKAVFVGLSEILLAERKDSFYTVFSQANGIFISGVEIAATAFANLLEQRPLKPLPLHFFIPLILFWGSVLAILGRMLPIVVSALSTVGLSLLYLVLQRINLRPPIPGSQPLSRFFCRLP